MATRETYKQGIDIVSPDPSGTGGDLIQDNFKTIADALETQSAAISGKASSVHTHSTSDITGLDTALANKAAASHTHPISEISNLTAELDSKAEEVHTHAQSDVTGLETALSGKANSSHTHTKSNITDFPALATVATSGSYNDLTNKPTIPAAYSLPTASTSTLGGVKVDGSTITINNNGVISASGGGGGGSSTLEGLTDVGISNPQTGEVLTFTGSVWQNATPEAASADTILNRSSCYIDGLNSLAVGYGNAAYANYSLAGGSWCETLNDAEGSFVMGWNCSNREKNSFLIGSSCINFGANSISTGYVNYNSFENAVTANGLIKGYYPYDLYHNKYGNAGFTAFRSNTFPFELLKVNATDMIVARIDILYYNDGDRATIAVSFKALVVNQEIKACELLKADDDSYSSESDICVENGALMYRPTYVLSSSPDFQVGIFFTRYSNSLGGGSSSSSSSSAY